MLLVVNESRLAFLSLGAQLSLQLQTTTSCMDAILHGRVPHVGPEQSPLIPSLPHILLYLLVSFTFSFFPFLLS